MILRPEKTEYAEFYANYVALANEGDVISALQNQTDDLRELLANVSGEKANFRYAAGKWSIKELFGHIIDAERVFSYRVLRISRGDETPLAGFEENSYVADSNFNNTNLADLIEEFSLLRAANVLMFKNLTEEQWVRRGTASDTTISVRALAFIMVGHVRHHANILRERYLV
ncbi:MAG TPA: DinB family protein [Pyrinomonadaceae bacterium]|nr:DinB family protein [Pyrinomonadaceae bacterium]